LKAARGNSTSERGAWAESAALDFLRARGLNSVSRNYRCRHGEIDLIMRDGDQLVFTEVRYRRSRSLVSAAESVDKAKQRRLMASAEHFLQRHTEHASRRCRFDVVSVSGDDPAPRLDWIRDAFEA